MLLLSRRPDESFYIGLDPSIPPDLTARELFTQGSIQIKVIASGISFARVGISLPKELRVVRSEHCIATSEHE